MSATRIRDDSRKDPETLEREIEETRADVDHTLEALQAKLSPGQLLDQALGMLREHGGEFARNLSSSVKQNPIPMLLTGVGLAWLMASQRSTRAGQAHEPLYEPNAYEPPPFDAGDERAYGDYGESGPGMGERLKATAAGIGERLGSTASGVGERVSATTAGVRDRLSGTRQRVSGAAGSLSEGMSSAAEGARYRARRARDELGRLMEEQPLVLGALGLALGAAIGAALPATEREDRLLGRTSDEAKRRARELGTRQYEQARETARRVAEGAEQALSNNGGAARNAPLPESEMPYGEMPPHRPN